MSESAVDQAVQAARSSRLLMEQARRWRACASISSSATPALLDDYADDPRNQAH
jgi:hypothetical protein